MRLSGRIKKRRLFKTFSCKTLRQFQCLVYLMLFIKELKPTQSDSREHLLLFHIFIDHNHTVFFNLIMKLDPNSLPLEKKMDFILILLLH